MVNTHSAIVLTTLALGISSAMAAAAPQPKAAAGATSKPDASGALPTKTVHRRAKPTACKAGERVSWPAPSKGTINLGRLSPSKPPPAKANSERVAKPALAARAPAEARPTPAPLAKAKSGSSGSGPTVTLTRPGTDGRQTVYRVLPPRTTRCYDPKSTGLSAKSKAKVTPPQGKQERLKQEEKVAAPAGQKAAPQAAKSEGAPKLSAQARDLIARYLADEMEQLD